MLGLLKRLGARFIGGDRSFAQVVLNSGWLLGGNTIAKVFKVVESIIVARLLGPEQFGVLALILAFTATVNQFVDSRVWETAIKYITEFWERGEHEKATATVKLCYLIDVITAVLVFIVLYVSADWAARVFVKNKEVAPLMQFYALSVLINMPNGTASALLRVADHFDRLSYQKVVIALVSLIGVVLVAVLDGGLQEILWAYLASVAAGVFVLLIWSQRSSKALSLVVWRHAPLRALRGQVRSILRFTAYSNLGATSRLITKRADVLLLGWLALPTEVGLYKLARTLADPLAVLFNPIYTAVYPEISKLVSQGASKRLTSLLRKLSTRLVVLVVPVCILLTIGMVWFIPFAYGVEYTASVLLTQIMVWQIVWVPMIWFPGYMLSVGRERLLAGVNWVDASVYFVLLLVLIYSFGTLGAAVATLLRFIGWVIMAMAVFYHIHRRLETNQVRL